MSCSSGKLLAPTTLKLEYGSHGQCVNVDEKRVAHRNANFACVWGFSSGVRRPEHLDTERNGEEPGRNAYYAYLRACCEKRTFLAAIREYGIKEESPEFLQLCELWDARHG